MGEPQLTADMAFGKPNGFRQIGGRARVLS